MTRRKITTSTAITHWPGVFIPVGVTSQNAVTLLGKAEIGEYCSLMNCFILATLKTNLSPIEKNLFLTTKLLPPGQEMNSEATNRGYLFQCT